MSGSATQLQLRNLDPENPEKVQNLVLKQGLPEYGTKIGFLLTLLIVTMTICILISVSFCQFEQNKILQTNEFKHNLTLKTSMNSIKVCSSFISIVMFSNLSILLRYMQTISRKTLSIFTTRTKILLAISTKQLLQCKITFLN